MKDEGVGCRISSKNKFSHLDYQQDQEYRSLDNRTARQVTLCRASGTEIKSDSVQRIDNVRNSKR